MTALWIREKSSVSQTKRQLQPSMPFDVGVVRLLYGQRRRTASRRSQRQVQGTQRGFSLVELLIVAAILTIVMAAVMGTLSLALQTTRNNSALVEANNNVRAALNIIKNDLDNVGRLPRFIDQDPNPGLGGDPAVYVRGGFLRTRGFPVGSGSDAPNRVGNIQPILRDATRLSVTCDILSPIQAWTAATHGASPPATLIILQLPLLPIRAMLTWQEPQPQTAIPTCGFTQELVTAPKSPQCITEVATNLSHYSLIPFQLPCESECPTQLTQTKRSCSGKSFRLRLLTLLELS